MTTQVRASRVGAVEPDYSRYDVEVERQNLRQFLEEKNLFIPEKFYLNIRTGDVIDLYTNPPQLSLLYCNSEFKRLCSYSKEQMEQIPFTQLFWRSDEIQQKLIHQMTAVALQSEEAVPWGIENHELVESLHPRKRTFEINLGWVAPCFDRATHERRAFVSSLKVALIFEWPDFKVS